MTCFKVSVLVWQRLNRLHGTIHVSYYFLDFILCQYSAESSSWKWFFFVICSLSATFYIWLHWEFVKRPNERRRVVKWFVIAMKVFWWLWVMRCMRGSLACDVMKEAWNNYGLSVTGHFSRVRGTLWLKRLNFQRFLSIF